jgi:hypothetical protein
MLPTMVLFPLYMIGSAALQAMNSFSEPAWAPVVFNAFYLGAVAILFVLQTNQEQAEQFPRPSPQAPKGPARFAVDGLPAGRAPARHVA